MSASSRDRRGNRQDADRLAGEGNHRRHQRHIKEASGKPGTMKLRYANKEGVESVFDCDVILMATGKRPTQQAQP